MTKKADPKEEVLLAKDELRTDPGEPQPYETTQKDLRYFARRVKYWQKFWGLVNWRIDVFIGDSGPDFAGFFADWPGKCATFVLSEFTPWPWTRAKLDRSAFHEVSELMVSELSSYAEKYVSKEVVQEATHDVVRRLENRVFRYNWKEKKK